MTISDEIVQLFEARGHTSYHGEAVSQTEHALQAAHLAVREAAPDDLVVAALLHDVGHLVHGLDEGIAERGIDGRHEDAGAAWLARTFGLEVVEPIRLHVAAKRYLCAVDPGYLGSLSPASQHSLALQGGPFRDAEIAEFESNPHHREALRLRLWDDAAKVQGLVVPGLDHYRSRIEEAAARRSIPR